MLKNQLLSGETYAPSPPTIFAAAVVMPANIASLGVGTGLASYPEAMAVYATTIPRTGERPTARKASPPSGTRMM